MAGQALLNAQDHSVLRVDFGRGTTLGDEVMACVAVPNEFRQLQNHYPILFQRMPDTGHFQAVALFGFEQGENLFLKSNGWDAPVIPLAMNVAPFLIGLAPPGEEGGRVHIDLDSPRICAKHENGEALFEGDGRPTAQLQSVLDRLETLDRGYRAAAGFFEALEDYELIEPLSIDITFDNGIRRNLVGFQSISEEALRALDGAALEALHRRGYLQATFMALASLGSLPALIGRRNRRLLDD